MVKDLVNRVVHAVGRSIATISGNAGGVGACPLSARDAQRRWLAAPAPDAKRTIREGRESPIVGLSHTCPRVFMNCGAVWPTLNRRSRTVTPCSNSPKSCGYGG